MRNFIFTALTALALGGGVAAADHDHGRPVVRERVIERDPYNEPY